MSTADYSTITYETPAEHVALNTLNRPDKLNSFDAMLRAELADGLRRASADDNIRVVVLTGAGRAFSAGADISDPAALTNLEDQLNTEYAAGLTLVQTIQKPVIAAVNGLAAGIGFTTALSCDLRVMGESSYLMCAFANIGLVPDGGLSFLLGQEVGYARAYQLMIEAEKIGAEKALSLGLVNRVVSDDQTLQEALNWAKELTMRAPLALSLTKRVLRAATQKGLGEAMAYEALTQKFASETEDFKEGVASIMEKRKPSFKGR